MQRAGGIRELFIASDARSSLPESTIPPGKVRTLKIRPTRESTVSTDHTSTMEREVRSLFISDLHLGSKFARAELLLEFLQSHSPEYLYLVGDIVDGWQLRRKWYWNETYNRLFDRLVEMANEGTQIRLTPGNHDEFLRRFLLNNEWVNIQNEFVHETADQRRFIILHGDLFDNIDQTAKWLSLVGNVGYELILRLDYWINRLLMRLGRQRKRISQGIKERTKKVVQFVGGFEQRVIDYAKEQDCNAVVCGHIHMPLMKLVQNVLYVNLGDWVENSTALIEYDDGSLDLFDMDHGGPIAQTESLLKPVSAMDPDESSQLQLVG
ncbi:MAG: UDP-2,3-diacylglucosamine diphosphatase [Planctomycetota bacterium]